MFKYCIMFVPKLGHLVLYATEELQNCLKNNSTGTFTVLNGNYKINIKPLTQTIELPYEDENGDIKNMTYQFLKYKIIESSSNNFDDVILGYVNESV